MPSPAGERRMEQRQCPRCQHANRSSARYCEQCATVLHGTCAACGSALPPMARFCDECGRPAGSGGPFEAPASYTPRHLAEKILQSRAVIEGERKHVTVLFADIRGS